MFVLVQILLHRLKSILSRAQVLNVELISLSSNLLPQIQCFLTLNRQNNWRWARMIMVSNAHKQIKLRHHLALKPGSRLSYSFRWLKDKRRANRRTLSRMECSKMVQKLRLKVVKLSNLKTKTCNKTMQVSRQPWFSRKTITFCNSLGCTTKMLTLRTRRSLDQQYLETWVNRTTRSTREMKLKSFVDHSMRILKPRLKMHRGKPIL